MWSDFIDKECILTLRWISMDKCIIQLSGTMTGQIKYYLITEIRYFYNL